MSLLKKSASPIFPRFSNLINGFFDDADFLPSINTPDFFPATNIEEMDDSFVLKMGVPGLNKEDVNVEVDKNLLVISANKEDSEVEEKKNYTRKEYNFSSFKRSFLLPESVVTDEIEATYKEGELIIKITKSKVEISSPKSISIN